MLRELHIRDLGVIEDATLPLHPGLTVVTGETGAGKTMVVTGLGLVLGGRADATLVRSGSSEAIIEASLELQPDHPALTRAADAGAVTDEPELLLSRTISAAGRSRAFVGGRRAPVSTLTELAEEVVAVHGQADQWRLRQPAQHRALLDAHGGSAVAEPAGDVAALFAAWQHAKAERAELIEGERSRLQEVELLTHQVEQIEAVDPQLGEDEALAEEAQVLGHAEDLHTGASAAHQLLSDSDSFAGDDVLGRIAKAGEELARIADHDPRVGELHRRLGELGMLASDLAADLSSYAADIEANPVRLESVEHRRSALIGLIRRYGEDMSAVLAHRDSSRQRLSALTRADGRIEELTHQVEDLGRQLAAAVETLTAARTRAAQDLTRAVEGELGHLGMAAARVEIAVEPRPHERGEVITGPKGEHVVTAAGADVVEIRVAANRGSEPRTVTKAASGGELSRIMLAIEVATADGGRSQVPTFVFDEVDAGVGGRAALDVGARLAALARTSQVIVVTHLAQVAAHADRHLVVHKSHDTQVTSSDVRAVEGREQLAEISRMMGGDDTEVGLTHARELREQCRPDRTS